MALSIDKYEYMNEDTIDDKLKCIICTQPLQSPVSFNCQHRFCQFCIETWIKNNASCPICRRQFQSGDVLTEVTTPTTCNQLDNLLVRCLRCKKREIQRSKFRKHFERCSKSKRRRILQLFKNRYHSIRKKYNHQTSITSNPEIVNKNYEQHDNLTQPVRDVPIQPNEQQYFNFLRVIQEESTSVRETMNGEISNENRDENSRRQRETPFWLWIWIFVVLLLVSCGRKR